VAVAFQKQIRRERATLERALGEVQRLRVERKAIEKTLPTFIQKPTPVGIIKKDRRWRFRDALGHFVSPIVVLKGKIEPVPKKIGAYQYIDTKKRIPRRIAEVVLEKSKLEELRERLPRQFTRKTIRERGRIIKRVKKGSTLDTLTRLGGMPEPLAKEVIAEYLIKRERLKRQRDYAESRKRRRAASQYGAALGALNFNEECEEALKAYRTTMELVGY
jgi:hypothetical protein